MIKIYTDGSCLKNPGMEVGLQSSILMMKLKKLVEALKTQLIIRWS